MPKKKTLTWYKKELDKVFSQYVRLRDAVQNEYCYCITCGKPVNWKYECDAGHFVGRSRLSTRFDEKNVNAQCKRCNNWGQGEQYLYGKAIDLRYGEGTADELQAMPKDGFKLTVYEYEALINSYKVKVDELKKEKGL